MSRRIRELSEQAREAAFNEFVSQDHDYTKEIMAARALRHDVF